MAKKNLTSLINGIMGEDSLVEQTAEATTEVTDDMQRKLDNKRKQNVGRPKKDSTRIPSNDTRATFIVDSELLRKLKYVSLAESKLLKEVLHEAISEYIGSWEAENGEIVLPKLRR